MPNKKSWSKIKVDNLMRNPPQRLICNATLTDTSPKVSQGFRANFFIIIIFSSIKMSYHFCPGPDFGHLELQLGWSLDWLHVTSERLNLHAALVLSHSCPGPDFDHYYQTCRPFACVFVTGILQRDQNVQLISTSSVCDNNIV